MAIHRKFAGAAAAAAAILAVAACRHTDLGLHMNTVTREYETTVDATWKAAEEAALKLELKPESDRHDKLGGELVARRADDSLVTMNIRSVDRDTTRVMVYVAPGNVDLAGQIHERIAGELGLGEARGGLFGGSSRTAAYSGEAAPAAGAARSAFRELAIVVTNEDVKPTQARIDGRFADSNPVRIEIERKGEGEIAVVFAVGTAKNSDNDARARNVQQAFERKLGAAPRP